MFIPVVIHKDPGSDFSVAVPDLPGCFSAGDTIEEAIAMVQEAIELHLEGMLADGEPLPNIDLEDEARYGHEDYEGGTWFLVNLDPSKLAGKAKRINVTIPEHLLEQIDEAAHREQTTRSGFLTTAAMTRVSRHQASNGIKDKASSRLLKDSTTGKFTTKSSRAQRSANRAGKKSA